MGSQQTQDEGVCCGDDDGDDHITGGSGQSTDKRLGCMLR